MIGQESLAALVGRDSTASVSRAGSRLVAAGHVRRVRASIDDVYLYQLLTVPGGEERWDEIPPALLAALGEREVSAAAARTWLHLDDALGARGFTADSPEQLAASHGLVEASTIRAHVQQLRAVPGLLAEVVPGVSRWYLERPRSVVAPARDRVVDDAVLASGTPEDFVGWGGSVLSGYRDAPDPKAPENTPSSGRSPVSHLSDARGLRPKPASPAGGVFAQPVVGETIRRLGPMWRAGTARRWLGGVAAAIDQWVPSRMSPAAAAQALEAFGEQCLLDAGGRHVPAARAALRLQWADIRLGLACAACGAAWGAPQAACDACGAPQGSREPQGHSSEGAEVVEAPEMLPVEQRLRVYAELGLTRIEIADIDPEAARYLRPSRRGPRRPRQGRGRGRGLCAGVAFTSRRAEACRAGIGPIVVQHSHIAVERRPRLRQTRSGQSCRVAAWPRSASGSTTPWSLHPRPMPRARPPPRLGAEESYLESCLGERAASGSTACAMTLLMTAISPECLT